LRRILVVLARNPELKEAVSLALGKKKQVSLENLYRLRRAGIFAGENAGKTPVLAARCTDT
jgi:hypothetical protein